MTIQELALTKLARAIVVGALLLLFSCVPGNSASAADVSRGAVPGHAGGQPNVLLIMLDDLNDYTGFLGGHPQAITPHMDALAKEGVVFANAHSNDPICAPSRSSMLTGIYPHVSGNYWFSKWYENETLKNCKTLARFMRDNGYAAFGTGKLMHDEQISDWTEFGLPNDPGPYPSDGKKPVGHPSVPEPFRSLDKNDSTYASLADIPVVPATADAPGYSGWKTSKGKPFKYVSETDRDLMNDELQANWIIDKMRESEKGEGSGPFFWSVGFSRPHTPLVAPQKYFDMYPIESLKLPAMKESDQEDCHFKESFPKFIPPWYNHYATLAASYDDVEDGLRAHLQAYLACVTFVDEQVGKVMEALSSSKFNDNTIVVLVSDHGYHQGEKQYLFKNSLWEESTRIPMIIRTPGLGRNAGKSVVHPVALIDIYPTVADLCGLSKIDNRLNDRGAPLSGFSMKPFLNDPENGAWNGPDVALSVVRTTAPGENLEPWKHSFSVRSKDYRYIHYVNGKEELYFHPNDEFEWNNLADNPEYAKIKAELKGRMKTLVGDLEPATPRH